MKIAAVSFSLSINTFYSCHDFTFYDLAKLISSKGRRALILNEFVLEFFSALERCFYGT